VKYPLILAFHGVGEDGDSSNTAYIDKNGLVSAWVATAFQSKYPCFVVAPHNPSGTWIDTNRLYVTGLSIGGWATWDLVTRFPEKFAAAGPLQTGLASRQVGRQDSRRRERRSILGKEPHR
jgi:predicted peptidase